MTSTMQPLPTTHFLTDAQVSLPALAHASGCRAQWGQWQVGFGAVQWPLVAPYLELQRVH